MLLKIKKTEIFFVIFLLLYEFSVYIANDMIMPGMLHIVKEFSVSDSYIPSSLSAFILGGASLQVLLGPLSDRYGRRIVMLMGVTLFVLSNIANGFANSIEVFMISRFFQGMGICFIGVIGYATIQEMFEEKKAVKIISLMTTVSILAPLLGPLAGSIYVEHFNWRGINAIIGAISLVALIGLYFYMPDKLRLKIVENKKISGDIKVTHCKTSLFSEGISNYKMILKNKKFVAGALAFSFIEIPLLVWIAVSPIVLVKKAGLSGLEYGFFQFPVFGGFILGVLLLQWLLKRFSLEKIVIRGGAVACLGLVLSFILPILFSEHFLFLVVPFSIYAIGLGIVSSPIYRLVLFSSSVAKGSVAAAFSLITMLFFGAGTESMAFIYKNQSNVALGLFVFILSLFYIVCVKFFLAESKIKEIDIKEKEVAIQK